MRLMGILAAFLAMPALVACGTHSQPYGAAPVVDANNTARQARIISAPNETARPRRAVYRKSSAPVALLAATTRVDEVQLQPMQAVYLASARETQTLREPAREPAGGSVLTVKAGDTVYALGRRFNVSPQSIIAENKLRAPYHLDVGQVIRLPMDAAAPTRKVVARDTIHQVRPGDTLVGIARAAGVEQKTIAQANGLLPPYRLTAGRQLLIPQARVDESVFSAAAPPRPEPTAPSQRAAQDVGELAAKTVSYTPPPQPQGAYLFEWPVKGAVIANFGAGELGRRNDGVNIAAPRGTPVRAAADGDVVYRGSELDGFGNLLLVRHSDGYVTAYAHNDSMLVKKGERVRRGQVIAKVGESGSVTMPQLHFEIRRDLKSVDPTALLGPQ